MAKNPLLVRSLFGAVFGVSTLAGTIIAQAADPLVISGPSPFQAGCGGVEEGVNYPNAEVEPWVDANPKRPDNLIAGWQQDRWSNGGSHSLMSAYTKNGGRSWTRVVVPKISRCSGGSGNFAYNRASDPWVTIAKDGTAYFFSLPFDDDPPSGGSGPNAMVVSRSTNGGASWGDPIELIRDTDPRAFNDKNAITADPNDARFVYAVWDRLFDTTIPVAAAAPAAPSAAAPTVARLEHDAPAIAHRQSAMNRTRARAAVSAAAAADAGFFIGPVYFSRTTNGGRSWEPARSIWDPGKNAQTIGNQVIVLDEHTIMDFYVQINADGSTSIGHVTSRNRGATWSTGKVDIDLQLTATGTLTPDFGEIVRDGNTLFDIAYDRRGGGTIYLVWQDSRDRGIDRVAFSRSRNRGLTWSDPVIINKTPLSDNLLRNQAFIPSIEVGDDHRLWVTYYDFRKDISADGLEATDYWAISCDADNGRRCTNPAAWGGEQRLTPQSFNILDAPFARGHFLGDYQGLVRQDKDVRAVFGVAIGPNENEIETVLISGRRGRVVEASN